MVAKLPCVCTPNRIISVVLVAITLFMTGCDEEETTANSPSTTTTNTVTTTTMATTVSTTTTVMLWSCETDAYLDGGLTNMGIKGLAVDDLTMNDCPDRLLGFWPNTHNERIKSLRLFAAWKSEWGDDAERYNTWDHLVKFVNANGAKLFFGVDTASDWDENEKQWNWALELMQMVGKNHTLGISFGNEMNYKTDTDWPRMTSWVSNLVKKIDDTDLKGVPVTIVWGFGIINDLRGGPTGDFLKAMHSQYGNRWVWTVNIYSIWDGSLYPHETDHNCAKMTSVATSIDYVKDLGTAFRKAINDYTQTDDASIWIGETGWSSPLPSKLNYLAWCDDFGSTEALKNYYENILEWDGSVKEGLKGFEYVFYFTSRDVDFQGKELFGLVQNCDTTSCKVQSALRTNEILA